MGLIGVVLAGIFLVAVAASNLLAFAVYGLRRLGLTGWRAHHRRSADADHRRAEIAARAELQHRWYLAGDPRGTYGRYTPAS